MLKLFFSYSHKDESYRDELEVHLSMLKRQGFISAWHDRRILAGNEFALSINNELESSDIILLLVSPYFLASDYCYDIEMKQALVMHQNQTAVVIPVILHPCDWSDAPFGELMATPDDGIPISKHANMHDAYLNVTQAIKRVVNDKTAKIGSSSELVQKSETTVVSESASTQVIRSSNLRTKREFSEHEKDSFLDESFGFIANYFEASLKELCQRNNHIECAFKRIDANHFTAIIYESGKNVAQCKVWLSADNYMGNICYSTSISSSDNSFNDGLSLDDDGYTLFFKSAGFQAFRRSDGDEQLTQQGAAEYFWSELIAPLQ